MLNSIHPKIEITDDGSQTLLHPVIGDYYHSTRGAMGEAMYIFIENGLRAVQSNAVSILEVGFGSGLNAYLTAKEAEHSQRYIEYTTIELYPIALDTIACLEHASDPLFMALHRATWGEKVAVTPYFTIKKIEADLVVTRFDATFDLVYFDAFAPESQPQLWSVEVFAHIYSRMNFGAMLVTYSAKGEVKRALREVGFEVKRLKGALGKRHMIRATKLLNDVT